MKIKHLVYLISLSIVLTGCGINNIEKTPYQQNQFKLKTAKEFSKYINEAELSEDTPNGLGLLIQRNASGDIMDTLGSCTWFLIDKDTAYTNSHCIPESLKEDRNLDCSQYIGGVFKTSIGQERRRCGKLIHFSKISEEDMDHPDYAIIKLNKSVTGSTDFDVSRSGFDDGEELGGHAVDTYYIEHDTDEDFSFYGSYKELNCLTYHKSIFGEFHEQRSAIIPIFSTEQSRRSCSVISGNSGSPATAAGTFTVKGIIFGGQKKDDDIIESDESLNLPEIETLGLLTNFRCMDLKGTVSKRSSNCQEFLKLEKPNKEDIFFKLITENIYGELIPELAKLPSSFRYEAKIIPEGELTLILSPNCMLPLNQWDRTYEASINSNNKSNSFDQNQFEGHLPYFQYNMSFTGDRFGRMAIDGDISIIDNLSFIVQNLERVESTKRVVTVGAIEAPQGFSKKIDLRLCTDKEIEASVEDNARSIALWLTEV